MSHGNREPQMTLSAAKPLPAALVKKLVKARIAESEAGRSGYEGGKAQKK